ncbi:MAG TPA: hypothetical protein VH280_03540 [Verrucomicrobiae bacterium]|jgi:hypothetical protein|nr:hypothetical protein [Verrucomicrobiae bacterium]
MKKSLIKTSLLIALTLPLLAGCVVYEHPAGPPPETSGDYNNPPPVQTEVVPVAPGPTEVWVWVPGQWEWRGSWVWVGGRWAHRPHPGAVWVRGGWGWHGRHRVWAHGYWR